MQENGKFLVGTGTKKVECRIINYCDPKERTEFRLATNLPETGEFSASNEEIGDFYRNCWQIELLWKFLKRCALVGFPDFWMTTYPAANPAKAFFSPSVIITGISEWSRIHSQKLSPVFSTPYRAAITAQIASEILGQ
jgi:hypothetical protein